MPTEIQRILDAGLMSHLNEYPHLTDERKEHPKY